MINHEFTVTGSSTAFVRLAAYLQGQGHQVSLLPLNPENGPIKARYDALGIPLVSQAVSTDFDLAIANTICAAGALITIGPYLRTIWFVNEAEVALRILLENTQLIPAFGCAAAVIYNMPFQHDVMRSFTYQLDQSRFFTNSFGVDLDIGAISHGAVAPRQRKLRAIQVGTMEPRKRPGDFIRAVAMSGLDMEAVICGKFYTMDDPAVALVKADPERFRLLQGLSDNDVAAWTASADIFCLASESETQALAVYEGALQAKPLILSDLSCYHGVFRHGREALLYPPGHVEFLALSLRMLGQSPNLRAELGGNARRAAQRYSNAAFFARFETIMATTLGRGMPLRK
jgi:glycosyltransferase involved in cell wall biosynthesis